MNRARWTVQYMQRVLATDPIAHWMQDEKQGLVSYDMVTARSDGARNGAYTAVGLGQPGIGDGRTSAQFDGATSYDDIETVDFVAAFNGDEGTALAWAQVANVGVWTDGASRRLLTLFDDAANRVLIGRTPVNNRLEYRYTAGGVDEVITLASASVAFDSYMFTWSAAADEVRAYYNGVQTGGTATILGAFVGPLTVALIGAGSIVPGAVWDGWIAHGAVWDRALSPDEVLSLGVL